MPRPRSPRAARTMTDARPTRHRRPHRASGARAVATGLGLSTTFGLTAVMAMAQPTDPVEATVPQTAPASPAAPAGVTLDPAATAVATADPAPNVVRLEPLPQAPATTVPEARTNGSR